MDFRTIFNHVNTETKDAPSVEPVQEVKTARKVHETRRQTNRTLQRVRERAKYTTNRAGIRHLNSLLEKLTKERTELNTNAPILEKAGDTGKLEAVNERIREVDYKIKRLIGKIDEGVNGLKPAYALPDGSVAYNNKATGRWEFYARTDGVWKLTHSNRELRLSTGEVISNPESEQAKLLLISRLDEKKPDAETCRCGKNKVEKDHQQCTACLDKADAEKFRHENESKKVNEDEGLMAGGATQANDGDRTQDPNYGAPDPVTEPAPKEPPVEQAPAEKEAEELPIEGEKEYLGNKGGEDYYYFVIIPAEDGTKDLQIQDANDEVVFSAKENQIETTNTEDFLWKGIQELQLSNISTEVVDKYLMPDEAPEDIEKEEGEAETGEEQEQPETEKPKTSGVIPELGAPAFKSTVGESKIPTVPVLELKMRRLLCKYGLNKAEETGENMVEKLMEKYGLNESEIDVLLEKYGLNEAEGVLPKAPQNVEDLEKKGPGTVEDKPATADAPLDSSEEIRPEPGMEMPAATEPAPEGGEPKAEDMLSSESAEADIRMKYPEEPFTTTAMAYADSLIDDPKVYGSVRNLKWNGVYANSETFLKQAKIVGKYNEFSPDIAQRLVDAVGEGAKFRLAREGSVSVYFTIRDPNRKISLDTLRDLVRADEADETGNAGEARLWWD